MKIYQTKLTLFLALIFCLLPVKSVFAGFFILPTDQSDNFNVSSFFDLRNRETFIQVTNLEGENENIHIQIFNVDDNCNENNFFDTYTINDTHVYNMRDIQTNDGNPSGVVLPEGAYGFVVISISGDDVGNGIIGNFRIIDEAGYEYRTNSVGAPFEEPEDTGLFTLDFNSNSGVVFSDVIGIGYEFQGDGNVEANIIDNFVTFDVDIIDNNETLFSCRDVIYSCVDKDNPLFNQLLEEGNASVASFEYGINNAIPHSKDAELLCPGNIINEGTVRLNGEIRESQIFIGYIGLNNGNGRGSMDSWWLQSEID